MITMTPFDFKLDELVTNTFNKNICFYCNKREQLTLLYIENRRTEATALVWYCQRHLEQYMSDHSYSERHYPLNNQDELTLRLILK